MFFLKKPSLVLINQASYKTIEMTIHAAWAFFDELSREIGGSKMPAEVPLFTHL